MVDMPFNKETNKIYMYIGNATLSSQNNKIQEFCRYSHKAI